MTLSRDRKLEYCKGCHNDIYNHDAGGASECWFLKDMKITWQKEVHINDRPPWKHRAKRLPNCYRRPKFVYVPSHQEY